MLESCCISLLDVIRSTIITFGLVKSTMRMGSSGFIVKEICARVSTRKGEERERLLYVTYLNNVGIVDAIK